MASTKGFRKCAFHTMCRDYSMHNEKREELFDLHPYDDDQAPINIKVIVHFLAPVGSYNRQRVESRAYDVMMSLNDDFNNYSNNNNLMNNFRYKSVVNQVFVNEMEKQRAYLDREYLQYIPTSPSNITFDLGQVYYYPIKTRLSLSQYDNLSLIHI